MCDIRRESKEMNGVQVYIEMLYVLVWCYKYLVFCCAKKRNKKSYSLYGYRKKTLKKFVVFGWIKKKGFSRTYFLDILSSIVIYPFQVILRWQKVCYLIHKINNILSVLMVIPFWYCQWHSLFWLNFRNLLGINLINT